jgi:hypothetical protein
LKWNWIKKGRIKFKKLKNNSKEYKDVKFNNKQEQNSCKNLEAKYTVDYINIINQIYHSF